MGGLGIAERGVASLQFCAAGGGGAREIRTKGYNVGLIFSNGAFIAAADFSRIDGSSFFFSLGREISRLGAMGFGFWGILCAGNAVEVFAVFVT